ncbi:hypothetical protein ONZ45_g5115 [Pleurotus djamor]|nr:hypothetical protein ONZ45_g5115 [Pleurotus djamor]
MHLGVAPTNRHDFMPAVASEPHGSLYLEEEVDDDEATNLLIHPDKAHSLSRRSGFMVAALLLLVWLGFAGVVASGWKRDVAVVATSQEFMEQRLWAQYAPFFPVEKYKSPPSSCQITQVNILQRHGARFPTANAGARIQSAIQKLQSAPTFVDPSLEFLRNFTYSLGTDDLVLSGAAESSLAGEVSFQRYSHLVSRKNLPFVRASSSERVVLSATNWTAGFSLASHHRYNPPLSVILSEDANDTLDDSMCPSAGSSDAQTSQWLDTFYPAITSRLNTAAPGANLTNTDTYNLISLCPFDTAARNGLRSPFCDIFDTETFRGFEYSGDLDKFYNTGYGQELGPVQGVGYLNELLARLQRLPVVDQTQTNTTLDSDPATFPLDRSIYADFSHDNQMIAIYAAMGLFRQEHPLDPLHLDTNPRRTWVASHLVPFGARMVVEKLACGRVQKEFVRILVNDAVQDLGFCGGGEMCELKAFVKSQAYARNNGNGDFEKCFE